MSLPRFYNPQIAHSNTGCLEGSEARHAVSVLRLGVEDQLSLFDGCGGEALATVVAVSRNSIDYHVEARPNCVRELPAQLKLAIALPKGDRQRTLVDAATELGVSGLIPLRTQRGVAQPNSNCLERLHRYVIEACKQCGRNRLMEISEPLGVADIAGQATSNPVASPSLRVVAHPYDDAGPRECLPKLFTGTCRDTLVAIGPEGGFSREEIDLLAGNGWHVADLGRTILRVEVAAISMLAQAAAWMNASSNASTDASMESAQKGLTSCE